MEQAFLRQYMRETALVSVIDEAKTRRIDVLGVVGRDGDYTKRHGDIVVVIPTVNESHVTPHTESFPAVVWHAIVSDPRLMVQGNKWETTVARLDKKPLPIRAGRR